MSVSLVDTTSARCTLVTFTPEPRVNLEIPHIAPETSYLRVYPPWCNLQHLHLSFLYASPRATKRTPTQYPAFNRRDRSAPVPLHRHHVRVSHNEASRRAQHSRQRPIHHHRWRCIQNGYVCRRASRRCEDLEESGRKGREQAVLEGMSRMFRTREMREIFLILASSPN